MKHLLRYWLILMVVVLSACDSLVTEIPESELPDVSSKLVVQCFISPQNTHLTVVVTESTPVFSEVISDDKVIKNATVRLSDGERELIIPFDQQSQLYTIRQDTFDIVAGRTYQLQVTDGKRTVKAACTVPPIAVTPRSFTLDTTINNNADSVLTLKMSWEDIPAQSNYYRVRASTEIEYSIPDGTDPNNFKELRVRDRYNFNWDDTFGRENYLNDTNLDGAALTSPTGRVTLPRLIIYDVPFGDRHFVYPKSKFISLDLELYHTDEHYYKYHRSLDANRNSDNPFVEPSLVYTNVEGGLGCFAAYNVGKLTFKPD